MKGLKISSLVDISINDCYLKFNCVQNYEKNLSDKHTNICVKRLFPSFTLKKTSFTLFFLSLLILFTWFGHVCNLQNATKYYIMFNVINKGTKTVSEICAKFIRKTPKPGQWFITRLSIFIGYFVYVSHNVLLF